MQASLAKPPMKSLAQTDAIAPCAGTPSPALLRAVGIHVVAEATLAGGFSAYAFASDADNVTIRIELFVAANGGT